MKCLIPVNTIAIPCLSAAFITSSSRIEPPGWITARTPSLAAAEMQKILEKLSKTHQLELKSVKVKDAEEKGEFLVIPLEIRLITDLNRTRKFLAGLEKNAKYLVIPKLKISVKNQKDPKEVIVTMVVTGFFLNKGAG